MASELLFELRRLGTINVLTATVLVLAVLLFASCAGTGGSNADAMPGSPTGGGGGGTGNSTAEFLFASIPANGTIAAWQIDAGTGALMPVPGSPFHAVGGQPQGMAVHPNGKFLYEVNFGGIAAYSISSTGTLAPIGAEVPDTEQGGAGLRVKVDPSGTHAYVASNLSIGAASFTINPSTGALTPLNPQPFDFQNHHGTEDLAIVGKLIYLTSAVGIDTDTINSDGSVTLLAIGFAQTPVLLARLAVSSGKFLYATTVIVPEPGNPFAGPEPGHIYGWVINPDGTLSQIASTPIALSGIAGIVASGNLLFASSPVGVTVYTIDSQSGALKQVAGSPFSAGSTHLGELILERSDKFLYAADANQIVGFVIGSGGALTPVTGSPFSTGSLQPFTLATTP